MFRFFRKFRVLVATVVGLAALVVGPVAALTIIEPTEGQVVRENVKIIIPSTDLPINGFVGLFISDDNQEHFVGAMGRDAAVERNSNLIFTWQSKASYSDPRDPMTEKFYKDGRYTLRVQTHNSEGKVADTAEVVIELRNKIARSNPAPAVTLVNRLSFGQLNTYGVHADVEVFEVVNNIGLPILGGLGIASDFKVIQSVEDIREDGSYMLRARIGDGAFVRTGGDKQFLYDHLDFKPQLYRIVDKYGRVVDSNIFTKQAQYSITDILPVLPTQPVKEGDSWPSKLNLKLDGLTDVIRLTGTSMLDCFEWQSGQECAKIISQLNGTTSISMADGNIRSDSGQVIANVTTWFNHKTGKMVKQVVSLEVPALVNSDALEYKAPQSSQNDSLNDSNASSDGESRTWSGKGPPPLWWVREQAAKRKAQAETAVPTPQKQSTAGMKKARVVINAVIKLEK